MQDEQTSSPAPDSNVPIPPESPDTPPPRDPVTDKAVDDIVKQESDDVLRAEDEAAAHEAFVMHESKWEHFKESWRAWWASPRKRWGTIGATALVIVILFAIPITRYTMLGLVLKGDATVTITEARTGRPVSGAEVTLDGQKTETNAAGKATLHVHLGSHKLHVSKKYYTSFDGKELVGLGSNNFVTRLKALGHQVSIKLTNKITGEPLANTGVTVDGAKARTNSRGAVTIVVSSDTSKQVGVITASGYNTVKVTIGASATKNTFALTPTGKLYFLSNLSGKIDVVKTNLDGAGRQTVLAGTGDEDGKTTTLLASQDWRYLALLSRRAGEKATVYLVDTTNHDKLTTVDAGNNDYRLVGWSGDNLVYQVTKSTVSDWQSGQQVLKSYNALTHQGLLLDSTEGSGTSESDYVKQAYGAAYTLGSEVVYGKNWVTSYANASALNGKQAGLYSISATGAAHRVVKVFTAASGQTVSYIGFDMQPSGPASLTVHFNDGVRDYFYDYQNGQLATDNTLTADAYNTVTRRYFTSPSGNQTFWSELRDGKNTLLVGDRTANNEKQIATLSSYTPYGWYTDDYLLVSKGGSELYIMSTNGGTALKVTDYYGTADTTDGYGS